MQKIKILFCLLIIIFKISTALLAEPINLEGLKIITVAQNMVLENYLQTDKGAAQVFGFNFDTYFWQDNFFTLAIYGAVGGGRGGYGMAAFGLGKNIILTEKISLETRFLLGSGGGGGLPCGNGFCYEILAGLKYQIFDNTLFLVRVGELVYPETGFLTSVVDVGFTLTSEKIFKY